MIAIERLPRVLARAGISKSTVYRLISEGSFPRPVPLGARAVGFVSEEVTSWIDAQVAARDKALATRCGRTIKRTNGGNHD